MILHPGGTFSKTQDAWASAHRDSASEGLGQTGLTGTLCFQGSPGAPLAAGWRQWLSHVRVHWSHLGKITLTCAPAHSLGLGCGLALGVPQAPRWFEWAWAEPLPQHRFLSSHLSPSPPLPLEPEGHPHFPSPLQRDLSPRAAANSIYAPPENIPFLTSECQEASPRQVFCLHLPGQEITAHPPSAALYRPRSGDCAVCPPTPGPHHSSLEGPGQSALTCALQDLSPPSPPRYFRAAPVPWPPW